QYGSSRGARGKSRSKRVVRRAEGATPARTTRTASAYSHSSTSVRNARQLGGEHAARTSDEPTRAATAVASARPARRVTRLPLVREEVVAFRSPELARRRRSADPAAP